MEKYPLIRKIYLYLFSLVGLTLMVISDVQLVNLGLKLTIFQEADKQQYSFEKMPTTSPLTMDQINKVAGSVTTIEVTAEQKLQIQQWLADYKSWQEQQKSFDPLKAAHQRDASVALSMLIIGLPLFLYHWGVIRRESKKEA